MDEAIEIVTKTCAYTNHTILAEALEKWPIHYLEEVVPHLMPIIRNWMNKQEKIQRMNVAIIDKNDASTWHTWISITDFQCQRCCSTSYRDPEKL